MAEHTYTWRGAEVEVPSLGLTLKRNQKFTTADVFNHPDAEEVTDKKAAAPPLKGDK